MHEFSIASALVRMVRRHAPVGAAVQAVRLRIGAMQSIVPAALESAWTMATSGGPLDGAVLDADFLPWQLQCEACGRRWATGNPCEACQCGCVATIPRGSDELTLMSIEVATAAGRDAGLLPLGPAPAEKQVQR